MNIKVKFLIFNAVLIVIITSGLGLLILLCVKNILNKEAEIRGMDLAKTLMEASFDGSALKSEGAILNTIQELIKREDVLSASVKNTEGKIIAHNDIREVGKTDPAGSDQPVRYLRDATVPALEINAPIQGAEAEGEGFLLHHNEETSAAQAKPLGFAQVQLKLDKAQKITKKIAFLIFLISVIVIFAAMGAVYFVLNRLLSPLRTLKRGADLLGMGNLDHRVEVSSKDEIADLSQSFNGMAAKLQSTLSDLKASNEVTRELNQNLEAKVKERTLALEKAQERLLQSEKMSAVGQLAAGVAHEINNPLGIIMGFAQGVAKRVKPGDPLEMPVKSIEREAVRCKNLVQDLLTFSRSDKSDRLPVDLNKAIDGALSLVNAASRVNSVQIEKTLAPHLPHVLGNQNQIQQVIINLANNAIDAMPKGGTLSIATEVLQDQPLSWACLKISDTGDGIPKEIQSKIFEPFFTTKPVGKGTGLGLSLVFEIVKKHSGTIEVQSRPGLTEFCVKFPIRTA